VQGSLYHQRSCKRLSPVLSDTTPTVTKSAWAQSFLLALRLQMMGLRAKSDKLPHGSAERLVLASGFLCCLKNEIFNAFLPANFLKLVLEIY